jgi:hypothetical protein
MGWQPYLDLHRMKVCENRKLMKAVAEIFGLPCAHE